MYLSLDVASSRRHHTAIASRLLVRRFLMATLDLSIIPLVKAGDRHGLHLLLSTCAESVLDDRDHVALPPDTFSDPIAV